MTFFLELDKISNINFLESVFSQIYRVTKNGRMCVVNVSPVIVTRKSRAHESKRLAIPFHFFSLMERIGWKYIEFLGI